MTAQRTYCNLAEAPLSTQRHLCILAEASLTAHAPVDYQDK